MTQAQTRAAIEKDPDFMFTEEVMEGSGEKYDLLSAIMGRGRKTKQGAYVLPYLQSGHTIGLVVVLLATFVYYPGFPLTELDEETRYILETALKINFTINSLLAVWAWRAASARDQPKAFWVLKTFVLGGLALDELRSNAPLEKEGVARKKNR
eukprot:Plantae.Rhodophyta-Rhodochaete_pulchella.ctg9329.p2 GENE.Plantae.Rhodophyta-Rhodochaete_pulchella.ctg9329~~Plantae.Rhodophyta-Rhodochaete_pulchella.ctg9329.p2  ORF type:complete len:153 (-),score=28.48 Plantae.Rhodophyta-Rhodochaete_pulchella.ctg9329:35-493(-)